MLEYEVIQELKSNKEIIEIMKSCKYEIKHGKVKNLLNTNLQFIEPTEYLITSPKTLTILEYKVNDLIEFIKEMDMKDKLKLAIKICESFCSNISYNKTEMLEYFYPLLENLDEDYKNFPVINSKYIIYMMARFAEMKSQEQNRIALYLFNIIKFEM